MTGHNESREVLLDQFAHVARALGNAKRLLLVDVLSQGERSVEALARATSLGVTTTSVHLQALRQGGIVATRRAGTRVYYRLSSEDVARLYVSLHEVARVHLAGADRAIGDYLGHDDVEYVSREELLERMRTGSVLVLDVRPPEEFGAGHIDGAVSIPVDELRERLAEIPPGAEVVVYCRGRYCVYAHDAVRLLRDQGVAARRLEDGMLEWRLADLPVAVGAG